MAHRDTSVSALCRELGIRPVTLYRYVGSQGELREQGQKVPCVLKPEDRDARAKRRISPSPANNPWLARSRRYGDIRKALLSAPAAFADADRSLPAPASPYDWLAERRFAEGACAGWPPRRGPVRSLAEGIEDSALRVARGRKPPCPTGPLTLAVPLPLANTAVLDRLRDGGYRRSRDRDRRRSDLRAAGIERRGQPLPRPRLRRSRRPAGTRYTV